jgi:hypothetical protein
MYISVSVALKSLPRNIRNIFNIYSETLFTFVLASLIYNHSTTARDIFGVKIR